MTRVVVGLAVLAAMFMLAPLASADADQATTPTAHADERPDDAAWADGCAPDMMCAAGANETQMDDNRPTRGPDGCENCRGDHDSGCTDCYTSHMPVDEGIDWENVCQEDMYCLASSTSNGPKDPVVASESAEAPALSVAALCAVGALASLGVLRLRRDA